MASTPIGRNLVFQIYNADGTEFTGLVMRKSTVESVVMSLGDKITGDVYYKDNSLAVTMHEYIEYNGVKYVLVNPPTVVREGMVSDNSELKGMTKYSFVFYHPMCQLGNFPFCDVAVSRDENMYLSENKIFSWIGKPDDYIAKLNKNLSGTQWVVVKSSRFPSDKDDELSDVIPFNNATIAEAIKTFYDTWGVPYIIDKVDSTESYYAQGKRFKVVFGLPSNEIYESDSDRQLNQPFVFKFGQGVGLKNNSRSPRNNKIVTRISGYGAERNIPYGYPQIPWYGDQRWEYTKYVNNDPQIDSEGVPHGTPTADAYPLYMGIVGGVNTKLIKHPFTRSYLMPSIYSQTVFNKVSPYVSGGGANPNYNPNITLVDYYDAIASQQYPYPNEINPQAPSYESHQFEDIYPELGSASITGAVPLDNNLQPASNWDDTMDDDGNYIQSYFQITLPQLTFDIYACAAITQEMEINMRSGACIGCTFPVEVDWDLYKANFYDEDGKFDPVIGAGHPRDPQKFPDSSAGSISVVVKKENTTFGTLMPNTYQHPVSGDEFVVLGISLPLSYITSAEQRLDESMKSYMLENNVYYFDYPLKFDEYWLVNHGYVLSQIRPNSIIRFEYAGTQLALYVKQLAVKYGENVLPQYDITLTDNVEVILNPIGRVADDVEKLSSLISILRENYNRSVWAEIAKKLSKVDDDTASGFIRFMKGLQVGSRFVSGLLGEGGVFRKNADGRTYLEVDEMYVRLKAYFDTVEIREYQHSHGGRVASSAGIKVSHVVPYGHYTDQQAGIDEDVPLDDSGNYHLIDQTTGDETLVPLTTKFYRCYYRAKDGDNTTHNSFQVGDLARCHMTDTVRGIQTKDYWRAVVGTNASDGSETFYNDEYGWTDLSNELTVTVTKGANSKLVVGYMSGSSTPEQGDDLFQLGNLFEQGRRGAIMENTTGPNTPSYQVFQDLGLDTRTDQSTAFNPYTTTGKNYIDLGYDSGTGHAKLNVIGDAFIGAADNSSYISYSQADKKVRIKAILDLASTFGDGGSTIQSYLTWNQTQINTLLGDINAIQQQIDGSIETWFYDYMPINPDGATLADRQEPLIWLDENHTIPCHPYYDWYTTDTTAGNNNERLKHLGDIFYDNKTGRAFRFSNTGTEANPHFAWVEIEDSAVIKALEDAARAQDTADNKRRVFVTQPPVIAHDDGNYVEYDVGDLWVNAQYPSGLGTTYNNDLLRCCRAKPIRNSSGVVTDGTFDINDWQLASKYTDDSALLEFLDGYQGQLTDVLNQIDKKAETWYQSSDPSASERPNGWLGEDDAEHYGDLWYCTDDVIDQTTQQVIYGKGTTWFFDVLDNGEGANPRYTYYWHKQNIPDSVFDMIDGKSTIYVVWGAWGNDSNLAVGDLYIPASDETQSGTTYKAGHVYRWKAVAANTYAWVEVAYTDDTAFNEYITQVVGGATASDQTTAAAAAAIRAVTGALVRDTNIVGGLILTSMVALRGGSNDEVWAGISGLYDDDDYAQGGAKGHGIAAWYGGNNGDREAMQEETPSYPIPDSEWSLRRWAKTLFRFDGSGYLANGNITWDSQGRVAIKDITTLVGGNDTDILNSLTTFNSAFHFTTAQGSSTILNINPQYAFSHLEIYDENGNHAVATHDELARYLPLSAGSGKKLTGTLYAQSIVSKTNGKYNLGASGYYWNSLLVKRIYLNADVYLEYDSANTAVKLNGSFYATGGIAALGAGSGGSGGGGVGDVTWDALAGQASGGHTIHHSYIDGILASYASINYVQSVMPTVLNNLTDVSIGSLGNGDVFVYDNGNSPHWTNVAKSTFLSGYALTSQIPTAVSQLTNDSGYITNSALNGYLPLSGGTMTGGIYWNNINALPKRNTIDYFVVLDEFAAGGRMKWAGVSSLKTSQLTNDAGYITSSASITGNAATATQLQTARTIWGQSFDGTADISGAISDATTISASSDVSVGGTLDVTGVTTIQDNINVDRTPYGALSQGTQINILAARSKNAGTGTYSYIPVISTFGSGETGSTNNFPVRIGSASGATVISAGESGKTFPSQNTGICNTEDIYLEADHFIAMYAGVLGDSTNYASQLAIFINTSCNVGIGTSSPSHKLDVAGTFYASGNSSIGGTFGVTGATTLSSTLSVASNTTVGGTLGVTGAATLSSSLSVTGDSTLMGNVGIGTTSPSQKLDVAGQINASSHITSGGNVTCQNVYTSNTGTISGFSNMELVYTSSHGGGSIYFHYSGITNRASAYIRNEADEQLSVLSPTGHIGLKVGGANGDYIQIGDIRIGYDSANNALEVYKLENNTHAAANLYARGGVSALGYGSGGSGGGVGDVTWEALAGQASGGHTIHHSYIDNVLLSYATESYVQSYVQLNAPHELSNLDDVVVSGVSHGDILTYNAVVVSPATPRWKNTSKSDFLSGYATESWVLSNFNDYTLPLATNGTRGGVQVGYTTSGKNYAVQLSSEKMFVNVPWENTTYLSGTAELLTAGTDTTDRVWSAKIISENVGGRQYYGTCSTAAATQAKVATIPASQNFRLAVGAIITIKFSKTNTFSATESDLITLNVNNTGAKQIWYNTSAANTGTNTTCYGYKNRHTTYIYDGTYWVWVSQGADANTTYSAGTAALLTEGTNTTNRTWQAKILRDEFDKYLPLAGGTMTGQITRDAGGVWISGRDNAIIKTIRTSGEGLDWNPAVAIKTSLGCWTFGSVGGEHLGFSYDTDADYNAGNNDSTVINLPEAGSSGTLALISDISTAVSGYAKLRYQNDLVHSGNEITMVPSGFSGGLHFNYQTVGGANGAITNYIFNDGSHGYAAVEASGFVKNGSNDSYVLLGGGDHALISSLSVGNADTVDGYHADHFLNRLDWWGESETHDVDTLTSGIVFAYGSHNAPATGTIVTFSGTNNTYQFQIMCSYYYADDIYFRSKNGDNNTWHAWRSFIHSGNIGSQSVNYASSSGSVAWSNVSGRPTNVSSFTNDSGYITSSGSCNYATSAGNADTLDGAHGTGFLRWTGMVDIGAAAPYQACLNILNDTSQLNDGAKMIYSYAGDEYTVLFSSRNDSIRHGTMLKWGYADKYIRIVRVISGSALDSDWVKIYAGYADDAGQLYTARSIWGNSFNGTADITGELKAYSKARFGYGAGSATINSDVYAIHVGTASSRTASSGMYYGGIAFNHMMLYQGGDSYHNSPQGWIGLRLYDTAGSERSYLVFATKEGTGTSNTGTDIPTERMCIDPLGNVGIGTTSPSQKLDVAGQINASSHITSGGNITCQNVYSSASRGSIGGFNNIQLNYQADMYPADGGGVYFHWNGATSYSSAYIRHDSNNHLQIFGYTSGFGVQVGSQNNDYLQVGGVRLVYDSANNALKVVGSDGSSAANFYATGAVSALGANTSGGGGTGISYKSTGNITLASNTWYRIASLAGTSNVGTSSFRIYSVSGNRTFSSKVILSLRGSSADLIKEGSCNKVIGDLRITTDGTNTYLEVKTGYYGSGIVIKADTYEDYSDLDNSLYGWAMYQSAVIGGGTEICTTSDDGRTLTFSGSVYCSGEFNSGEYYCSGNIYSEGDITTENDIWASGDVHGNSFINSSDARLKDIQDYEATIDLYTLAYAPSIHFKWNNKPDTRTHVGTIAQYWQGAMPEVVSESKDGYLSMQYDVLALLAAISVAKKVVDHERRIMELEEENAYLRYEINQLKKVA